MTVAAHKQNRSSPDVGGGAGGAGARAGGYLTNVLIRKDYQPLLSHSPFNLQPHNHVLSLSFYKYTCASRPLSFLSRGKTQAYN
ncbi:hypothetical protein CBS115989_1907 [Aspergillus niger]|nr:hypothetical protein CBS115989_1907 [Aspergillus niger]KAI2843744.1 hypothetical protein CBS12448_10065 [Aspergillus niger]KAI2856590.1 hypothetical protein CBS11232_3603 [Aspergillus niger]KAI2881312.1 hypothetical protein CBS115988_640 [Aspergillus niger]KAI2903365.1 hypothetical protein CBS13152_1095 [Aspergillus niger]